MGDMVSPSQEFEADSHDDMDRVVSPSIDISAAEVPHSICNSIEEDVEWWSVFSRNEVCKGIDSLKRKKSQGGDEIPGMVLKDLYIVVQYHY